MRIELDSLQARVIGCMLEKQITTPDQYPLSLNALVSACNQKSNREPVMSLDEASVQRTLDALSRKHLVLERSGFGSRVPKYQHLFCNTEYGSLKLTAQELAIVCELLLRGPQTPGELRSRASRMAPFTDASQVEVALQSLLERESGALVARLAREPGRREVRYMHLFGGEPPQQAPDGSEAAEEAHRAGEQAADALATGGRRPEGLAAGPEPTEQLADRVATLEQQVRQLRRELEELKSPGRQERHP